MAESSSTCRRQDIRAAAFANPRYRRLRRVDKMMEIANNIIDQEDMLAVLLDEPPRCH